MVLWGITAAAMMFVKTPMQFYIARFLLGVFEAGFFPGIILYFTYWYPSVRRGQIIAIFMSATTIVSVIACPLCGGILKYMNGFGGLAGWQWLFVVEGLPAALLGVIIYLVLQNKPADADWLTSTEKNVVRYNLETDVKDIESEKKERAGRCSAIPRSTCFHWSPAARRHLYDGFLVADVDPELGRQGSTPDRHLFGDSECVRRHRHDPDRPQFRSLA
jgi:MFS family permease